MKIIYNIQSKFKRKFFKKIMMNTMNRCCCAWIFLDTLFIILYAVREGLKGCSIAEFPRLLHQLLIFCDFLVSQQFAVLRSKIISFSNFQNFTDNLKSKTLSISAISIYQCMK